MYAAKGVTFALVVMAAAAASAQEPMPPERRGAALLSENCAMCHAIGRSDASAEPRAPALRTIARRIPLDRLKEELATGLMGGHPAMPKFTFGPREAAAIVRYLRSIQEH